MKKLLSLFAMAGIIFSLASCSNDDDGGGDPTPDNEVLTGSITEDMTLTNDRIWELSGRVFVTGGATLTIEAGTIIKGQPGTGTNSSGLYIARDGMIDAVGTASSPIIFTSVDDNIEVGELQGTNLTEADNQLWGGVVILGNAPISVDAGTTAQIEGVPAAESLGQYGGSDAADDRGTFKYVSIRHGGTTIDASSGSDINGLTLGGVGSGTEISDIEIYANFDDGIEFFGGSVNVSNILVYKVGDDAIDVDQAYSGTIDNFLVYTGEDSDEVLEIDGPEGTATGSFTIQNGTAINDGGGNAADFKSSAMGTVENVKWTGFSGGAGAIKIRASFNADCSEKADAYLNLVNEELVFTDVEFFSVLVYDGDEDDACDLPTGDDDYQLVANEIINKTTTTGATSTSGFDTWAFASLSGSLGGGVPTDNILSGNITSNTTLTADVIWELSGRVFVTGGATLTIEPGTIIKGQPGTGTNASGLYIARDGKINAAGDADNPIIFTSVDDNIEVGQKVGTNLTDENQLWGGVVILGNAEISVDAGTTAQIEGVPASETLGQYGGSDNADDRGVFKYVSIRHGGTTIDASSGSDINGLTLGGVGSGTEISHIEIYANFDDGIEFFGGSVDVSHLLIYKVGDDAIDVDQSYSGTISEFMVYTGSDSDEGLEIDGPEGTLEGSFTIQNGTIIADGGGNAADFKSQAMGSVENVKWSGFAGDAGNVKIRASFDANCDDKADAYTNVTAGTPALTFATVEFASLLVYDSDTDDACDLPASYQTDVEGLITSTTATGITASTVFDAWTYVAINNLF